VEAAAAILADIDAEEGVVAEVGPPSSTAEAVAETPQETATEVDLDPELPPDILMDLQPDDDPDELGLDEEQPWQEVPQQAYVSDDEDEYVAPEVAHLRAELKRANAKADYEKGLRLKSERKKWVAEAAKFFPLADPSTITSDSRRAFRREAQAQHERMKNNPQFQAFLENERQRVRREAEQAWGKPTSGPGAPPSDTARYEDEIQDAKRSGRLDKVILARMRAAGVDTAGGDK
jgi:hypothetical protein